MLAFEAARLEMGCHCELDIDAHDVALEHGRSGLAILGQ